jgi:5-methyltetrahydropteroyltriglutamate--homocysteine methyltransferase
MAHRATPPFRAELGGIEDEAIRDVVKMQEDVGLQSATDGEFRRASLHMDFIYPARRHHEGSRRGHVKFHNEDDEIEFNPAALHVDGKLGVSRTIFGEDFAFVRDAATSAVPRLTILSYLQSDDTSLAYMNDRHQGKYIASIGGDPERQHVEYIHHTNEALAHRPDGMSITTHMCRGNFRSSWAASGSYDYVADALFNELEVDGFFVEWDDERSGGFEPLRLVPKGKVVVLGLVTTKHGELEDKHALKRRIEEASRHVDVDQLCLSPQCGFSSTVEGNNLSYTQEVEKLRLVVEVPDEVWG